MQEGWFCGRLVTVLRAEVGGITCEGIPKTQNGQTEIKFRTQDLHTMTATFRDVTLLLTVHWHRTVNGRSENDKIRTLNTKA